jgi:hypothetical protein
VTLWPAVRGALVVSLLSLASAVTHAAPTRPPPKATPLPASPTLPRIHLEAARDHVLVVEDVLLGRGEWASGDLDTFVAFGAPGLPRAIDARLYAAIEGDDDSAPSEPIAIDRAFHRPAAARLLLGVPSMAGAVLHVREAAFRRATGATGVARVRIRTLMDLPALDAEGGREVVIRLGAFHGEPYALDAIDIVSLEPGGWLRRAEAQLCGLEADAYPLAIKVTPAVAVGAASPRPVAPVLSVRHASDDLCVRFWTAPESAR